MKPGAVVLLKLKPDTSSAEEKLSGVVSSFLASRAALIIVPLSDAKDPMFQSAVKRGPRPQREIDDNTRPVADVVMMLPDAAQQMWALADGSPIKLHADVGPWETTHTWNVLAKIDGGKNAQQIILLSAHLDHLGVVDGKTYPGADDDASGTVAVMELARALAKEPQLQRTVVFALFGSEEKGLIGARYFLKNPTFPLKDVVANLNFEMIGRADPKLKPNELWLTGWERTNLGPSSQRTARCWSAIRTPNRVSFSAPTTTRSRATASSRNRYQALACTPTTTRPPTPSTKSTGRTSTAQ